MELKVDEKYKFAWTAIPYEIYKKHLITVSSTAEYSNMIVNPTTSLIIYMIFMNAIAKLKFWGRKRKKQ